MTNRQRCLCGKRDHNWLVTPPGGEPRRERFCSMCAGQLEQAGYKVQMVP